MLLNFINRVAYRSFLAFLLKMLWRERFLCRHRWQRKHKHKAKSSRDVLLETVARNTPELYRFTFTTYACGLTLVYANHIIPFREGPQQGDPLSSLEFCESIRPILSDLESDLESGFIDDLSMSSDLPTLAKDVEIIVKTETSTGLELNTVKCEIIMDDFSKLDSFPIFKDFIRIAKLHYCQARRIIFQ